MRIQLVLIVIFSLFTNNSFCQQNNIFNTKSTVQLPTEYEKVIESPILNGSPFRIYILNNIGEKKLCFLKKGRLSDTIINSKFYVHLFSDKKSEKFTNHNFQPVFEQYYFKGQQHYGRW